MVLEKTKEMQNAYENMLKPKKATVNGMSVEIRQYVPYLIKVSVARAICEGLIENGDLATAKFDLLKKVNFVSMYADLTNGDLNIVDFYDYIMATGVYKKIVDRVPVEEVEEFNNVCDLLRDDFVRIEESKQDLNVLLNKGLGLIDELVESVKMLSDDDKLEDALSEITNTLSDLDPSKLEYVNDFMSKISDK